MQSFLQAVAQDLYRKHKSGIQDVCLVFPGRRAGVFFSRHLSKLIDKPLWLPPIRTISELMTELSGAQVADPLVLIFELYEVYRKTRDTDETFDNFYAFGEMLLGDFDDIDKYLVDTRQLFQNISDIKEIDRQFTLPEEQLEIIRKFWGNLNIYEPGKLKEEFLGIWAQLHRIYEDFGNRLRAKGLAYEGMTYRNVYEKIKQSAEIRLPYKHFAIIGFNALNECEKAFFSYLDKEGIADFYWDYDAYYTENTWHEAGFFIRENLKKFPQRLANESFKQLAQKKNIKLVNAPSDVAQAKLIPALLKGFNTSPGDLTETAIVLADEQLLIPVLSSIPASVSDVNVTLGYPFRLTAVHSFVESVISLHKNIRMQGNTPRFYFRDVVAILNHPYIQTLQPDDATGLHNSIVTNNRVFISAEEAGVNELFAQIFRQEQSGNNFPAYLNRLGVYIANQLKEHSESISHPNFHLEYWFTLLSSLNRLSELLANSSIDIGLPVMFRILRKMISGLSVPFRGEPLAGLQVMGVLETRTLDFKNVIILSMNEGILPKTEAAVSYIPYNLRKGFGLPTIEHQDAIFAYYFYRLIQRAENVTLVYNSQPSNGSGEMSRFLYQLKYEPAFNISEESLNFSITLADDQDIVIPKTPNVFDTLNNYTNTSGKNKYLTPTALSAYMECSLRFYFRYIAKIKEKDELVEDIEASMFGKLLHYAMQTLYKPYLDKLLDAKKLDQLKQPGSIENAVNEAFGAEYFKGEIPAGGFHGKSIIVKEVLMKYIAAILKTDKEFVPFAPKALEEIFSATFPVEVESGTIPVSIGGVIDRIDMIDGKIRILDYKTGVVDFKVQSLDLLFDREGDTHKFAPIFQALFYCRVLEEHSPYNQYEMVPGLYGLREIFDDEFDYHLWINKAPIDSFTQVKDEFVTQLTGIIQEIFDPAVPFTKVEDRKKCEYCAYKNICHR